jgi:hypothetical protein
VEKRFVTDHAIQCGATSYHACFDGFIIACFPQKTKKPQALYAFLSRRWSLMQNTLFGIPKLFGVSPWGSSPTLQGGV